MAENEIDATVLKRTQQTLGKYVKKPALSDKLLRKPPFRFLHDVFNVVIKETGCFQGLYTADELTFENIKDRDDKMNFLKKMIDVIKITTGNTTLTVRASKIVCGHEPEKTNELLQQIAEVIEKKLDWQSAVQQVTGVSNQGQHTTNAAVTPKDDVKSKESKRKAEKPAKDNAKAKDAKSSSKTISPNVTKDDRKPKRSTPTNTTKDTPKPLKEKERTVKEKSNKTGTVTKEKATKEAKSDTEKRKIKVKDAKQKTPSPVVEPTEEVKPVMRQIEAVHVPAAVETNIVQNGEPAALLTSTAEGDKLVANEIKEGESEMIHAPAVNDAAESLIIKRKSSGKHRSSGGSRHSSANKATREEITPTVAAATTTVSPSKLLQDTSLKLSSPDALGEASTTAINATSTTPTTTTNNGNNKTHSETAVSHSPVQRESTFTRDNSITATGQEPRAPQRTTLRPPSARPASARPGAPRKRNRNVEIVLQPNDEVKTDAGINVKLETFGDFGDDDVENLVIIDNSNEADINFDLSGKQAQADDLIDAAAVGGDMQQGHLVQQILETQKELVQQPVENKNNLDKQQERNSAGTRQNAQQMDNLRDVIQNLTKAVNPFGKIIDFLPEDIDAMQLEMGMWRDAYQQAAIELKRERSLTESVTEPMKTQLTQIEANIAEYAELIDASRMKILQNSEKIVKMLSE